MEVDVSPESTTPPEGALAKESADASDPSALDPCRRAARAERGDEESRPAAGGDAVAAELDRAREGARDVDGDAVHFDQFAPPPVCWTSWLRTIAPLASSAVTRAPAPGNGTSRVPATTPPPDALTATPARPKPSKAPRP